MWAGWDLDGGLLVSRQSKETSVVFSTPVCDDLLQQPQETIYQANSLRVGLSLQQVLAAQGIRDEMNPRHEPAGSA